MNIETLCCNVIKRLKLAYNKSADGLRGFASLNVTMAHFVAAFLPSLLYYNYPGLSQEHPSNTFAYKVLTSTVVSVLYNGHFAVVVFFVLSGYVLAMPAFQGDSLKLKKRFWGRYLRLNIPVVVTCSMSFVLLHKGFYFNGEVAKLTNSIPWFSSFFDKSVSLSYLAKAIFYKAIFLTDPYLNPPLWTIALEFIGSAYVLIFFSLKPARASLQKDLLLLSLAFVVLYFVHGQGSLYYMAMLLGGYVNIVKINSRTMLLAIFVIGIFLGGFQFEKTCYEFLPSIGFGSSVVFDIKTFYNTLGALFLVVAVVNGFASSLFQSKVAIFLGFVSYPIYLLHFLVLCSLSSYMFLNLPLRLSSLLVIFFAYIVCVLLLGFLFSRYVDVFAISMSHKFSSFLFHTDKGKSH